MKLNWVTFEELLELSNLVEEQVPGKYKVTRDTWEQILREAGLETLFKEFIENTVT